MDAGFGGSFYFLGEGVKFRGGTGHEEDVEAAAGELQSEFFADAIRGAGDEGPTAFGAE